MEADKKLKLLEIVKSSELSIVRTCEILKLKPWRYYHWKKRYRKQGLEGLKNHKSTPESCPHSLLDWEKKIIIEQALKQPDLSSRKLAYYMQNEDILYVSPSSVYRVLKKEGLVASKDETPQRKSADGKIEVKNPNEMWHTDITYIPVKNGHGYLISVLDGYSRYVIHSELSFTMTADDMERILSRALFKSGLFEVSAADRPVLVSDNGTQMVAKTFTKFLDEWDIEHIRTAVRHPESNGKIEVLHKTIKYENVYVKEQYKSFYEARDDLAEFIHKYNHSRLHQAIGYVTPYQKYSGHADEIISQRKKNHQKAIERRKRLNRRSGKLSA